MNLNDFYTDMVEDLKKFSFYWEVGHKKNPDQFPAEMNEVEWYEQFLIYMETKDR